MEFCNQGLLRLPDEVFHEILRYLTLERFIRVEGRYSLSIDSFQPPPPSSSSEAAYLGNFRLACERFSELGIEHQFAHIDPLSSWDQKSFKKLDFVAVRPDLARTVKKLTLKVPRFYPQGGAQLNELLNSTRQSQQNLVQRLQNTLESNSGPARRRETTAENLRVSLGILKREEKLILAVIERAQDQQYVLASQTDLNILRYALSVFTSLTHINLLRVEDKLDDCWLRYLEDHDVTDTMLRPSWTHHGMSVLGLSYLASNCASKRFSSKFTDTHIPMPLGARVENNLSTIISRLRNLELQFVDGQNLEARMLELSPLFRTLFTAAVNMQTIHIQFAPGTKVSIPLTTVFHNISWPHILVIGIAHWQLSSEEIIDLVSRHPTLYGLRLKEILLKEGSRWDEILRVLRSTLNLTWLSLSRSNYVATDSAIYDDSDDTSANEGPDLETKESMQVPCMCQRDYNTKDDLGDNGVLVTKTQLRFWEQWATGRCYLHDPRAS